MIFGINNNCVCYSKAKHMLLYTFTGISLEKTRETALSSQNTRITIKKVKMKVKKRNTTEVCSAMQLLTPVNTRTSAPTETNMKIMEYEI